MAYGISTAEQLKTRYGGLIFKVVKDLPDNELTKVFDWLETEKNAEMQRRGLQ